MIAILTQRQMRRETDRQRGFEARDFEAIEGSPDREFDHKSLMGDPSPGDPALQQWLTPEELEDVKRMIQSADNVEAIEWLNQTIPSWVMQQIDRSKGNGLG